MKKRNKFLAVFLAAVCMMATTVTAFADAAPDGSSNAANMPWSSAFADWKANVWDKGLKDDWTQVSMTPGKDETSVNFAWYSVTGEMTSLTYGTKEDLSELEEGDVIAVPNDTTNEARALLLLQDNGVIKLKDGVGLEATARDIEENPNNVEIQELEAAQVSRVAGEVAFVVLNGNYALQAGYSVSKDAVAYEKSDSEAAQTYVNVIAVQEGNEDSDKIKALVDVLKSDEIKDFITENYDGAVIPFEDSAEETEAAE